MNLDRARDSAVFLLRVVAGLLLSGEMAHGAGEWSLDAVIRRGRRARLATE